MHAHQAYSSKANRAALRARNIVAVIPERSDQKANRDDKRIDSYQATRDRTP